MNQYNKWKERKSELEKEQKTRSLTEDEQKEMERIKKNLKTPLEKRITELKKLQKDVQTLQEEGEDKYTEVFMWAFEGVNNNLIDRVKRAIKLRKKYSRGYYDNEISFASEESKKPSSMPSWMRPSWATTLSRKSMP